MAFAEKLYLLRTEKKISQEKLAEKIDVTRQTISNWELGRTQPNPEQLKMLSQILNVSIDELLENDLFINKSINDDSNVYKPTETIANVPKRNIYKIISIGLLILSVLLSISLICTIFINNNNSHNEIAGSNNDDKYIVVYNPDNGEDLIAFTVYEGSYLNRFIPPEKEGYVFNGWYFKDKEWDYVNDRVYENIILIAKWEQA